MQQSESQQEGLRERKRRETMWRIAEAGLNLFIANGYEETTLDAIAETAGIARRTFFHYFSSKEEILLAWQSGMPDAVRAALLAESTQRSPLETVRGAMLKQTAGLNSERAVVVHRILRSNEQLRAGQQTKYLAMEQAVFEALCQLWPQTGRRKGLRMVAIVSVGAARFAMDAWADDGGHKPLASYIKEAFAALHRELADTTSGKAEGASPHSQRWSTNIGKRGERKNGARKTKPIAIVPRNRS